MQALSSDSLLQKCAHGGSQNSNESYHNLIWARCPKTTFVGKSRLELAVADATIVYNSGEMARLAIYDKLGLTITNFMTNRMKLLDRNRIDRAYLAGDRSVIKARRARSQQSAGQKNDITYGAGKF